MSQFTRKERIIASVLSATPRLKGIIKRIYVTINFIFHRKGYKSIVFHQKKEIKLIEPINKDAETFYGYYDKSPENDSRLVILNETESSTSKKPTSSKPLWIRILNLNNNEILPIGMTFSYNWQQGCRCQWVSDNRIIYNIFDDGKYKANLFDIVKNAIVEEYDYPVQDCFGEQYFLSINYARIMNLRPDYGYRNLPLLSDEEMNKLYDDGIWKIDISNGESKLIISLEELTNLDPQQTFTDAQHKVNHVMISPDGKAFIFIHRWYVGLRRHDRLIYSDFKSLKVLASENMVSHMCWVDNDTLFGYLRHDNENGFYFIDIKSGIYKQCKPLTNLGNGDGHPSVWQNWIVVDTYPDKSRLQHLNLYNIITEKIYPIVEVFQSIKYQGESRCDMHPRFSRDGSKVYFDTVFTGKRRLAYIDVSELTKNV